jgi:hypothetical protein
MTSQSISDTVAINAGKFTQPRYPIYRVLYEGTTIATNDRDNGDLPEGAVQISRKYKTVVVESVPIDHVAFARRQTCSLTVGSGASGRLSISATLLLKGTPSLPATSTERGVQGASAQLFAQFHNPTHHCGLRLINTCQPA